MRNNRVRVVVEIFVDVENYDDSMDIMDDARRAQGMAWDEVWAELAHLSDYNILEAEVVE